MNAYWYWPPDVAAACLAYDAVRHLEPTDPCRMAALDRVWFAMHPDWVVMEYDCVVPF